MDAARESLSGILALISVSANPPLGDELRYHVRQIPETPVHFFGRDNRGLPCLLLAARDVSAKAPIRLAGIEVRFAVRCRIVISDGGESEEILTAVLCTSQDAVVQGYFVPILRTVFKPRYGR